MKRNPDRPLARALAKPGHELQHRFATAEPTPSSSRSPRRRSRACLELEHGDRELATRLPPEIFDLPVEKMREGYYTDAYFNHTRARCSGRPPPARRDAGLPAHHAYLGGMDEAIAILKLCSDGWDALR